MPLDVDGKVSILRGATSVVAGASIDVSGEGRVAVEARGTTSSGTGEASVEIQVSNNNSTWQTAGTINLNLATVPTSDRFAFDASWTYVRAKVASISGTGASVSVYKITGVDEFVTNPVSISAVVAPPYRLACWGQERANGADTTNPEVINTTRTNDIRSPYWVCAYRGDMVITADYGNHDGSTGIKAVDWNNSSRTGGKTFTSFASKASQFDAVLFNYGGTDISTGNGTTPTAATVFGYLQANILAILRLGVPVIVESIYPYMGVAVYRGVTSGWTAAGSGTAAQKQAIADATNELLAAWIATLPANQVIFVDVATALKGGGTFAHKNYMVDGIELNMRGAMMVGKMVAEASDKLLPLRRAMYLGQQLENKNACVQTPDGMNLKPGFTNYNGTAGTAGTISWGTPTVGFDGTYGPYFEVTATCSAITGLTPKNITSVTWSAGVLQFTVASHNLMPTQKFVVSGLSGSIAGSMTGPYTVSTNDSETEFSVILPYDPGALTIAGSPPSSSSQITVQEAYANMFVFTDFIKQNGTPSTGVTLSAGDMVQTTAWAYADDGANGPPPLTSLSLRQRIYYQAGTPTSIYTDAGIFGPTSGNCAFQGVFGPVRLHTTPMVTSNTSGGGSSNVSNAIAPAIHMTPVFNAVGSARLRLYSPSFRVIQPGPIVISTPASGTAYTNKAPHSMRVLVGLNGATISAATVDRGDPNTLYSLGSSFLTGGEVTLAPNDRLTLTYTVATPTMTGFIP